MALIGLALRLLASLALLCAAAWGVGLLLFRLPQPVASAAAIGFGLAALAGIAGLWTGALRLPLAFTLLLVGLIGWWNSLQPSHQRDWIPELARLPRIERQGDRLAIENFRHFTWRTEADYDIAWQERSIALDAVEGVDLFLSYWSGEAIAHLLVSFTLRDDVPLTFSIEVRREKGEEWSSLAGFFRSYEMAYVAADERDVVGLRTHARREDVRLFRLAASPQQARDLLLAYVADINRLAQKPRWYNTLGTNCTTVVYRLVEQVAPGWRFSLPLDPRVLLSGYLPGYLQRIGAVRQDLPLAELVARGRISERARTLAISDPAFSRAIREGIPNGTP